jgi:hypothetical protein
MKLPIRLVVISLVSAIILSVATFAHTSAETTLTSEQLQHIRTNCLSIKNTLDQLHASDALLRVNRGQLYESMASKLMDRFNTRVTSNGIDAVSLTTVTVDYRAALNSFRSDYQSYEEQLSLTMRIDCTNQPASLYDAIENSRTKRTKVHGDVVRLHQLIDDYQKAVDLFAINYSQAGNGSAN